MVVKLSLFSVLPKTPTPQELGKGGAGKICSWEREGKSHPDTLDLMSLFKGPVEGARLMPKRASDQELHSALSGHSMASLGERYILKRDLFNPNGPCQCIRGSQSLASKS